MGAGGKNYKEVHGNSGDCGYVCSLDSVVGFTGVNMSKLTISHTFNMHDIKIQYMSIEL